MLKTKKLKKNNFKKYFVIVDNSIILKTNKSDKALNSLKEHLKSDAVNCSIINLEKSKSKLLKSYNKEI